MIELSSSASKVSRLVHRDKNVTAVVKTLAQYSKTFNLSHVVSFEEARVTDIARNIIFVQACASCGRVRPSMLCLFLEN